MYFNKDLLYAWHCADHFVCIFSHQSMWQAIIYSIIDKETEAQSVKKLPPGWTAGKFRCYNSPHAFLS